MKFHSKICFKCKLLKPLNGFYKHKGMLGGHVGKCKECTLAEAYVNWYKDIELSRKQDRERRRPERNQTNGHNSQDFTFEEKRKVNWTVGNAVRSGRLKRRPCKVCGNPGSQGHHEDYAKTFDVIWLCQKHHKFLHRIA